MYSDLAVHPRAVDYAERQSNLTVLARDGAVAGTRRGLYRPGSSGGDEHFPWLHEQAVPGGDPKVPIPYSRLGDFHYFGLFLEQLCGGGDHGAKPVV